MHFRILVEQIMFSLTVLPRYLNIRICFISASPNRICYVGLLFLLTTIHSAFLQLILFSFLLLFHYYLTWRSCSLLSRSATITMSSYAVVSMTSSSFKIAFFKKISKVYEKIKMYCITFLSVLCF